MQAVKKYQRTGAAFLAITFILSLVVTRAVYGQASGMIDQSYTPAAMTVLAFDYFAAKCERGRGGVSSEKVKAWKAGNGINQSRSPADVLSRIESFGFHSRMKMGIGGFMTVDIYPVVLFRAGDALTNVGGLTFAGGLDAHKRAKPGDWTRWRRAGGKLQLSGKDGWKDLAFQTTYATLPIDFRLDGLFRLLSGAGTVAVGGGQEVAAWREYHFSLDGRVVRGNGVGGRAEAGDISVATESAAPNRRGRYRVDGLTLHITYDDGSGESRILITDPKEPKSAIWLDGVGYARRRQ